MKKIYLSLLSVGLLASSVLAQTPEKKSMALINKITGVKCYYCGEWGWDMAKEVSEATEGKALFMEVFVSFGGDNSLASPDAVALNSAWLSPGWGGIPDFGVNGVGITTGSITNATLTGAVNTFDATDPVASPANKMTISGNTMTVNAKAQFWSAASGEYYLAAYMVEDSIVWEQSGPIGASGPVAHHDVLRGSMSTGMSFGEQIANGSVTANQTFDKTFTFNITDATWRKSKMSVYTVIWKKNGTKYEFVNASKTNNGTTSIEDVINTASVDIFPNPAMGSLFVSMDVVKSCTATFNICDITGRQLSSTSTMLKQGNNKQTLNTATLTPGLYILNVQTENGTIQKKFVKG
ncbi:Omp28-related outer membrane protein [Taibaiella lutea]|uniref:Omp28-related outer membrane protein n=1 Tax=Taibaiella lutea TaxID=2608001 RepID=A0A5M6CNT8_9BACT|nr:Omp28-related outer membrane protein [Taibaiella lutea]KAA5536881.1 Omp28-related outer membrane protein [Taibaiella lutea]